MNGKIKEKVVFGGTTFYYGEGVNPIKGYIVIWGQKTCVLNSKKSCLYKSLVLKVKRYLNKFFNKG
jgi:hypothetical protein